MTEGNPLFSRRSNKGWQFSKVRIFAAFLIALVPAFFAVPAAGQSPAGEALRVHGHWTVEIAEPNGSVVRVVEFDNALTEGGQIILGFLLNGAKVDQPLSPSPGESAWSIDVRQTGVDAACSDPVIATSDYNPNTYVVTLTASLSQPADCLTDNGGGAYGITRVATRPKIDRGDGIPFPFVYEFTAKDLDQPITGILPDQVVTIKVEISFS
jgi:hypothetical protein